MLGIKSHSHAERARILAALLPKIKKRCGRGLRALAAQGSFARGEDGPYSDLELIAFLKKAPRGGSRGRGWLLDGMLVELIRTTRALYIKEVKEVGPNWYIAGSDRLLPLLNRPFIERLNCRRVRGLRAKCLRAAGRRWQEYQEATTKVLNAVAAGNRVGVPLTLAEMWLYLLSQLSFLNARPYTTLARFDAEARRLPWRPPGFAALARLAAQGGGDDLPRLASAARRVYAGMEREFLRRGGDLGAAGMAWWDDGRK